MDSSELETFQVQLKQVELALSADPTNTELLILCEELKSLIELTKEAIAQAEASKAEASRKAASLAASAPAFSAGDEVLAKYSGDGAWYPARVTSVGGATENRVYSVVFKGYNNTELLTAAALKPLPPSYQYQPPSAKRKITKEEDEERERKKKKNEKKVEIRAQKAQEQLAKQATWQKFTKKAEKKGVNIAGVAGKSIFKTPDNPHGKVGVTGSGKGMTEIAMRGKHVFVPTEDAS
ncbi:hypothetical protein Clacol_003059 [Clathrus columnatus]|uniref:Tudor domain-containing protein n=1 Tax=Clathrus columnatus TaxID=1419009 RepID=A0AAV5A794_9AGAM|nr:hypothetical protein Clacol_003059 [Clathrus columnatus]